MGKVGRETNQNRLEQPPKAGQATDQRAATLKARFVETEIRASHRTPK